MNKKPDTKSVHFSTKSLIIGLSLGTQPALAHFMPRKTLIRTSAFPYHITNRSNNKDFFYVDNEELWEIFISCFKEITTQFECEIHGFILMSNHYHLLISTPKENIGEIMKYLHREVARLANKTSGRINHFFGGRYKWAVISNELYYWNSVKYIFRNPIRAGICKYVEEYKFSSLNTQTPLFSWKMIDFFSDNKNVIELDKDWLNEPFLKESEEAIQKALRRREFKVPRLKSGFGSILDTALRKKGTVTL